MYMKRVVGSKLKYSQTSIRLLPTAYANSTNNQVQLDMVILVFNFNKINSYPLNEYNRNAEAKS